MPTVCEEFDGISADPIHPAASDKHVPPEAGQRGMHGGCVLRSPRFRPFYHSLWRITIRFCGEV
jgi:hypothetical protein